MCEFNVIAEHDESTVVAKYEVPEREDTGFESEAKMEATLIQQLQQYGYEYVKIGSEEDLINNLRRQMEQLNGYVFKGNEWERLFYTEIAKEGLSIEDKTEIIQHSYVVSMELDNGERKNFKLIDKKNIHNNRLQVINQYVPEGGSAKNRYDVTILVNGLPLVHVELKKRGVSLKEAFNQIERYQRESFWSGSGLFEYAQLFVISNGTQTKYYSNTTRYTHVKSMQHQRMEKVKSECNSFEFTSYWSDQNNRVLYDLRDFTNTFFAKRTLLNVLTRYCVFTVDRNLLVMRPYQIAATEKILLRIKQAMLNKRFGHGAGGYIWHTTGSGKTLTSFKTAQLAANVIGVEKVLFVVDRQDLDYQTMREYDNFEKGCANGNSNSNVLLKQLNDISPSKKIIITTIQKLNSLLSKKDVEIRVLDKPVVMIFDECHRSQFGEMHDRIVKRFKKYIMFGFTGTPIFAEKSSDGEGKRVRTTAQVFCDAREYVDDDSPHEEPKALHTYTIIDAIRDKNVLPFKVEYVRTMRAKEDMKDEEVWDIDRAGAMDAEERVENVAGYILDTFAQKTKRYSRFAINKLMNVKEVVKRGNGVKEEKKRVGVNGFNGIFAVDSVKSAIKYYHAFKDLQQDCPEEKKIKIAMIFTAQANGEETEMGFIADENPEDASLLTGTDKTALEEALEDYYKMFKIRYGLSGDGFQNYYKDVALRMKNKEIDLLIVVGMFLTGFDAKTLNTLWVDKNLRMHGLLQAFSRTNRILNSVKTYGNIVCFRNLEERVNESLARFGDKDAAGLVLIRSFNDYYYNGFVDERGVFHRGYKAMADELLKKYPVAKMGELQLKENQKEFVKLFGLILKRQNLLESFVTAYEGKQIVSDLDMQDYLTWYNTYYEHFTRDEKGEKVSILDDVEFEMELVKQVQVDIDYILSLVNQYHDKNCEDKEQLVDNIRKALGASPDLRDKRELIEKFIERISGTEGDVYTEWEQFVDEEKENDFQQIVKDEKLREDKARAFIEQAFADGYVTTIGTALVAVLPPVPLFGPKGDRLEKKNRVIEKFEKHVNKFKGLVRA